MRTAEPPAAIIEILPPDGRCPPPERRHASVFRPYTRFDGRSPGSPVAPSDRRCNRRTMSQESIGRRVDLEG
jgi:hypothetical protein